MTTIHKIDLTCPNCATEFTGRALGSTNSFGGRTTDLHYRAVGAQPLPIQMNICPTCGYSGFRNSFDSEQTISPAVKALLDEQITPRVQEHTPLKTEGFEFTAMIAERDGARASQVAELYLMAAWCCGDIGHRDREPLYREQAIAYFKQALDDEPELDQAKRALYTYIIGENYRRIGSTEEAYSWYDRTVEIATDDDRDLVELARQQKADPREMI